ncbi:MAG: hypothetical protein AB2552_18655 [Candidatus Thiodiazotropha endolucinida]
MRIVMPFAIVCGDWRPIAAYAASVRHSLDEGQSLEKKSGESDRQLISEVRLQA